MTTLTRLNDISEMVGKTVKATSEDFCEMGISFTDNSYIFIGIEEGYGSNDIDVCPADYGSIYELKELQLITEAEIVYLEDINTQKLRGAATEREALQHKQDSKDYLTLKAKFEGDQT